MKAVRLGSDGLGSIFGVRFELNSADGPVRVTMAMGDASALYMELGCAVVECVRKYRGEGIELGAGGESMQVVIAELARAHQADDSAADRARAH